MQSENYYSNLEEAQRNRVYSTIYGLRNHEKQRSMLPCENISIFIVELELLCLVINVATHRRQVKI